MTMKICVDNGNERKIKYITIGLTALPVRSIGYAFLVDCFVVALLAMTTLDHRHYPE